MESVVDKMEALVQKADSDLNFVALRLDSQFTHQFSQNVDEKFNPVKLLDRIRKAREELKSLLKEASELNTQKKEIQTSITECLLPSQQLLQTLQLQTGTQVSENTPEEEYLIQHCKETIKYLGGSQNSGEQECINQNKENIQSSSNLLIEDADSEQERLLLRKSLKEFVAVTEDEFSSVSMLVKGRVKLEDVNKVNKALFNHFKTNKKSSPLTVSDMTNMGLKITGATGQAKLKVLRYLKIIQITNKGAVKWQT